MRPPPMVRMHKGYCKQCNKCMDSIISPEIFRKYGREYYTCEDCKYIFSMDITSRVIEFIQNKRI